MRLRSRLVFETILSGSLTASGNSLVWKPDRDVASLLKLLEGPPSLRLVRVTLKGHKIWSVQGGQFMYLDGQVFAKPGVRSDGRTPRTRSALSFRDGGYAPAILKLVYLPAQMVAPPPKLASLTITPTAVQAGQAVSITVALDRQVVSGGAVVALTKTLQSGTDPIPSVASVTVPEGQAAVTITVPTLPNVAASMSVKATLRDTEAVAQLNVQVVTVTISPPSISLLANGSVQVTAVVTGTTQMAVAFAIAEGARGGALAQTGANTAMYTAPALAGTYHIVATSVADPSRNFTATITVVTKRKDSKEGEELVKSKSRTQRSSEITRP
ncbi:MAG: hypothetical protein QM706_17250 [Nitrospira sp.]